MSVYNQFFGSASAIPNQTNTNSGSVFPNLGGGGGGGGSANPVVSTLTFSAGTLGSGNTNGTINMSSVLNILDPSVSTPTNFHFQFQTNLDPATLPAYVSQYQSTLNGFTMYGPSDSITTTGNFGFSADILGRSQITATNATGNLSTLSILADSVLVPTTATISSLSVSTINGAAPGGGGVNPNGISTSQIVPGFNGDGLVMGLPDIVNNKFQLDPIGGMYLTCTTAVYPNITLGTPSTIIDSASTIITGDLNVSSVNGGVPALTSLFSTLFAANPSLSTIAY